MKLRFGLIVLLFLDLVSFRAPAGTLIQFHIYISVPSGYAGDLDVELYDKDKPVTVNNFLRLIEAGAYQNSFFHRCLPGTVMQGGGFFVSDPTSTSLIGPPYANIGSVPNFGSITNEFKVGTFFSNTNGTIAMAKTSDPNSASSGFFFNLADNSASLDNTNNAGGFTVFGHVVRDPNHILDTFRSLGVHTPGYGYGFVNLTNVYGTNNPASALFITLPNANVSTNAPPVDDLIYYTFSILSTSVKLTSTGARQITWTSISGVTNNLEFTTNLPPVWQVLFSTNGNGAQFTFTDSTINKSGRFYRVHVLY